MRGAGTRFMPSDTPTVPTTSPALLKDGADAAPGRGDSFYFTRIFPADLIGQLHKPERSRGKAQPTALALAPAHGSSTPQHSPFSRTGVSGELIESARDDDNEGLFAANCEPRLGFSESPVEETL